MGDSGAQAGNGVTTLGSTDDADKLPALSAGVTRAVEPAAHTDTTRFESEALRLEALRRCGLDPVKAEPRFDHITK